MLGTRMRGSVPLFSVALCAALTSDAHASGPVSLHWSAPEDCPTRDEVLDEVNRLLGARAASDETAFDVSAEVTRKDDETYQVRLEIPGADGSRLREVSAVSCVALGQTTALILAMMVDPEAALTAAPAPAPPSEPLLGQTSPNDTVPRQTDPGSSLPLPSSLASFDTPARLSVSKRPVSQVPVKKSRETRRPQLSFSLQMLGDLGSLPGPAFGLGGALGILPGRLRFEVGGAYFFEKVATFSVLPKAGSNVNLWNVHAAGGVPIVAHPKLEFTPRVRFDVGRFHASSFQVSDTGEGAAMAIGVGAGLLVSLRIARYVRVGLGLDGVVPLAYPRFIVTGVGVAHEPSSIVGRLALGAEWGI